MAATDALAHAPPAPARPVKRNGRPLRLSFYVLRQMLGPALMLAFLLTSMIWMVVGILPLLDLVINRGQSAVTFLYLALLYLPTVLTIVLPFAFLFGSLFALQRLAGDSELVVMASAGFSLRQLATPVLGAALVVMAMTWACSLYFAPAGQRTLNAKKVDINADVGAALLNEGQFNSVGKGITVFIKQINTDGSFNDILVHDGRDPTRPTTYVAASGQIVQTQAGARLLMREGTLQSGRARQLSTLKFDRYVVGLDQFASQVRDSTRRATDRFLPELLWPPESNLTERVRRSFIVEAHNRLSQPLYCLAFGLIALAAVVRGRRQRSSRFLRLTGGALAALGLYIGGFGVAGAAQGTPELLPAFYLIPLLGIAIAALVLAGYSPAAILARRRLARDVAA